MKTITTVYVETVETRQQVRLDTKQRVSTTWRDTAAKEGFRELSCRYSLKVETLGDEGVSRSCFHDPLRRPASWQRKDFSLKRPIMRPFRLEPPCQAPHAHSETDLFAEQSRWAQN